MNMTILCMCVGVLVHVCVSIYPVYFDRSNAVVLNDGILGFDLQLQRQKCVPLKRITVYSVFVHVLKHLFVHSLISLLFN